MTRSRPITLAAIAAAVALAALAVRQRGDGRPSHESTVGDRQGRTTDLGKILVDSRGRSLYMLSADSARKSTCFGACVGAWPPLRASHKPTVGRGLKASKVGTIKRSDGKSQVTYNGHPLYRFVNDKKPGDTNGQGITAFGGRWFVLSPAGKRVSASARPEAGATSALARRRPSGRRRLTSAKARLRHAASGRRRDTDRDRDCRGLIPILFLSQALNAVLLLVLLPFIRSLGTNRALMAANALGRGDRIATGLGLAVVAASVLALAVLSIA